MRFPLVTACSSILLKRKSPELFIAAFAERESQLSIMLRRKRQSRPILKASMLALLEQSVNGGGMAPEVRRYLADGHYRFWARMLDLIGSGDEANGFRVASLFTRGNPESAIAASMDHTAAKSLGPT
jgi:hypothetical protein